MYVGADYYPEHWDRDRWRTDLQLMKEAGFNIIRIAEFSWQNMEPKEGCFEFKWLTDFLDLVVEYDIKVIIGTPTAIVPVWAAKTYPEILALRKDGTREVYGVRKNNCFTSGAYRFLSRRIVSELTRAVGLYSAVIGWQPDNEFGGPECRCGSCQKAFQDYLQEKYETPQELNRVWGLHFWGHSISHWNEIVIPENNDTFNPSQVLDYRKFHSWLNYRFQKEQVDIIHKKSPGRFATHNFMGLFPVLDYYEMAEDLDFISWDNYPNMGNIGAFETRSKMLVTLDMGYRIKESLAADLMRGLKNKNFWIMEQTSGPIGWGIFSKNTWPGELRNIAYQQLAHGCDGQIWFRWRACTAGREQYWHGILGHDGVPGRRYNEVAQTTHEYINLLSELDGSIINSEIGIIFDYNSQWALMAQPGYEGCNYQDSVMRYYEPLYKLGLNVDIVNPDFDFSLYKIIIAPHLHVLPIELANKIDIFVASGGIFLTDCRTGVKNESNLCYEKILPGLLNNLLGIEISEYESLENMFEYSLEPNGIIPGKYTATMYADWVETKTAESIIKFSTEHMKNYSLLTKNKFGKGYGFYVGSIIKEPIFYEKVVKLLLTTAKIEISDTLPYGIQCRYREKGNNKYLFIINHLNKVVKYNLPQGIDLLTGHSTEGVSEVEPFGISVIKCNL